MMGTELSSLYCIAAALSIHELEVDTSSSIVCGFFSRSICVDMGPGAGGVVVVYYGQSQGLE